MMQHLRVVRVLASLTGLIVGVLLSGGTPLPARSHPQEIAAAAPERQAPEQQADAPPADVPTTSSAATAAPAPPAAWTIEVGDHRFAPLPADEHPRATDPDAYRLAYGRDLPLELMLATVDSHRGVHLLFLPDGPPTFEGPFRPGALEHLCRGFDGTLVPVVPGEAAMRRLDAEALRTTARGPASRSEAIIAGLVDQVDADRWYGTVVTLGGFHLGQRHSSTQGFREARDWVAAEFEGLGLDVTVSPFAVGSYTSYNVIGTLTGSTRPDEFLVVGAHLDSLPSPGASGATVSPGAEDNASGSAAVLEMARIVAPFGSQRSIVFITFGGEEQGLVGSTHYVNNLTQAQRQKLQGAIIMDMIGFTADAQIDVLLETTPSTGGTLRTHLAQAAADFTTLTLYTSDQPFGSDHMPFINAGLPGLLAIENDWDRYTHYHRATDTPLNMVNAPTGTKQQGAQVIRMNVGALLRLANPDPLDGCFYDVAPATLPEFPYAGGSGDVTVTTDADCAWEVAGLPAWVTADPTSGTGGGTVTLTAAANTGGARTSTGITVAGRPVQVSQAAAPPPCTFGVSPRALAQYPAGGGERTVTVTTQGGCAWSVTGLPSWITAEPAEGVGSGVVTLTAAPNDGEGRSTTTILVAGSTISASQAALPCTFDLEPASVPTFAAAGGSTQVVVTTRDDCGWFITGLPTWLTAQPMTGAGDATITLTAQPNDGAARSSNTLAIGGVQVPVSQEAPSNARSGLTIR